MSALAWGYDDMKLSRNSWTRLLTIALGGALTLGAGLTAGKFFDAREVDAASTLLKSYNFLDGGSSSNGAYAGTNIATNVGYAADNPGGTSGTTAWEADYANLSMTTATRLGGKLVSAVQTDNTTAWANIKTTFTFSPIIEKVEILGTVTFGTAGNTTALYLQSSTTGTTWTTQSTTTSKSGTITFDSMTIPATSYLRFGIALTASSTNSGIAFTGIRVYQQDGVSKTLSSIAVTTQPTNKSYYNGDSFNPAGMVVTATYSDSSTANVTASCTYTPSPLTTGTTSVTVSYTEGTTQTATITGITVAAISPASIVVKTQPTQTTFEVGNTFSSSGLVVTVTYENSSVRDYSTGFSTDLDSHVFVAGDIASGVVVTVSYTENSVTKTTTYTIDVIAATESVQITRAAFGSGSGYTDSQWSVTASTSETVLGQAAIYLDSTAYMQLRNTSLPHPSNTTVMPGKITQINITMHSAGSLRAWTPYVSSSTALNASNYSSSGTALSTQSHAAVSTTLSWDVSTANSYKYFYLSLADGSTNIASIVIKYAPNSEVFGTLDSIAIASPASKLSYVVGETFSSDGLALTATDTEELTKSVTSGFTTNYDAHTFVSGDVGTKSVTISYTEAEVTKTTSYNIEVLPAPVYTHDFTVAGNRFTGKANVAGTIGYEKMSSTASGLVLSYLLESNTSNVYVGNSTSGSQMGSSTNPSKNFSLRTGFIHSSNTVGIVKISVVISGFSGTIGNLSAKVGNTAFGDSVEYGAEADQVYTFTSATAVSGHISLDFDNTSHRGVLLRSITIWANEDATSAPAVAFADSVEALDTCSCTETDVTTLRGNFNALSAGNQTLLNSLLIDDYANGDSAHASAPTFNRMSAYAKWAYLNDLYPEAAGTLSTNADGDPAKLALLTSVIVGVVGLSAIAGFYFVGKKKTLAK